MGWKPIRLSVASGWVVVSLRTVLLSLRSHDPVIGPLESTGGQVRDPRIYKSRKFAGLILVGLLSIVGAVVKIELTPAKPSDREAEAPNPRSSISEDRQATVTSTRLAEPAAKADKSALDDHSSVLEVQTGGQDAPTGSDESNKELLVHPTALGSNTILPSDLSNEPSPVPSQPPVSPVLLRPVDRTALQNLTASLLAADHARPKKAEVATPSAALAQGRRHRQQGRITPVQRKSARPAL
jgi:hypothetical protein